MTALAPAPSAPRQPQRTELTLEEVRQRIEEDDKGKWDVTVRRRDLTMRNGEIEFPIELGSHEETVYERLSPTGHAFGQVCSRLGMPAHYLRACPLPLRDQNANYWLREGREDSAEDERWLLRARHGDLRAALSERFSPLDNAVLLDALRPSIPASYRVQWLGLEEESLHLRVIDPEQPREVLPGDAFQAGVHIANSEVGARSLTVDALVYRLVCGNGLISLVRGKSLLRRRHVHISSPRFRAELDEALSQAMAAADGLFARLQLAAGTAVPDPELAIDRLAKFWKLGEATAEVAKAALMAETSPVQHSAFGLVNAFTEAAQRLPDEKRYDLEVMAGQLAGRVPRFALSPAERMPGEDDGTEDPEDVVSVAIRTFDDQVVGRQPHAAEARP